MTNAATTRTEYNDAFPWGTHLCAFHSTREELAGALAPYFNPGLQGDELCVWVTSDPSGVEGAKAGLRKVAPELNRYLDSGQIQIRDFHDWYLRGGRFDADRAFGQFMESEARALASGYKGLRTTGDMAWLEKGDWPGFMAYEAEVNRVLPQHRVIALCTYPLDRCTPDGLLEVVRHHQFDKSTTILNERLRIETSVSEQLQQFSARLLGEQDEERRRVAAQLHEETAQNVSAIAMYIASLQQRPSAPPAEVEYILATCHKLCDQSLEQILTLSYLLHPPIHDRFGLAASLHSYIEDFVKQNFIHVEFEAGAEIGRLPLEMETHLFRVAQEGLSNVLRHSGSLNAIVRLERRIDQVILEIEDFGRGMSPVSMTAVSGVAGGVGLGILGMQVRLRKIGGRLEIRSSKQGTVLTASVRL